MKRDFLLATAKVWGRSIVLILVLFTLPTYTVFAAGICHSITPNPAVTTNGDQQIPTWSPPLDPEFSKWDNHPVTYDPVNGAVEQGRFPDCKTCLPLEKDYYKPDPSPTPIWPASPTAKIIATWPAGETSECSGMLVDSAVALTAGHCVYTHTAEFCNDEESCWVSELTLYLNYGTSDVQESSFTQLLTWTAWTENQDYKYDIAGIKLDQLLGNSVGWLGFGYNNDDQFFPNKTFEHTSYADNMLTPWSGMVTAIDEHQFYTDGASNYGQAGAGLHSNDYFHIIYSVLSHKIDEDETITGHTRITPDKFFALRDWINGGIKKKNFIYYMPLFPE
ncbi:MAG: trypsin-like serine peptidase [Brevefilum sp.]